MDKKILVTAMAPVEPQHYASTAPVPNTALGPVHYMHLWHPSEVPRTNASSVSRHQLEHSEEQCSPSCGSAKAWQKAQAGSNYSCSYTSVSTMLQSTAKQQNWLGGTCMAQAFTHWKLLDLRNIWGKNPHSLQFMSAPRQTRALSPETALSQPQADTRLSSQTSRM